MRASHAYFDLTGWNFRDKPLIDQYFRTIADPVRLVNRALPPRYHRKFAG